MGYPQVQFNKHKNTGDGLQNCCKSCKAKMNRNWKYSMKSGRYEKMAQEQGFKCAICLKKPRVLFVDHCHKTERLRGLLCRNCNSVLGMCDDNIAILNASIEYLNKWVEE